MKRTFHDAFGYGRETAQLFVYSFSRANVLFVTNLTQEAKVVQFSSAHSAKFSKNLPSNYINNNELSALTPPRSVAIISVSVRSAEVRLELYV